MLQLQQSGTLCQRLPTTEEAAMEAGILEKR